MRYRLETGEAAIQQGETITFDGQDAKWASLGTDGWTGQIIVFGATQNAANALASTIQRELNRLERQKDDAAFRTGAVQKGAK